MDSVYHSLEVDDVTQIVKNEEKKRPSRHNPTLVNLLYLVLKCQECQMANITMVIPRLDSVC